MPPVAPKRPRVAPKGPKYRGLPTLTKQQFRQVQPGGEYANYMAYLKKHRKAPTPPAPKGGRRPARTLLSYLRVETPKQLEQRATRMVNQQIAAQRNLLLAESQRSQADALRQMQAMSEAGRAAAAMNAGLFGQVGGEYNAAAQEMAGMATGLAGGAGATTAADVANINAALGRVGAPGVEAAGVMAGPGQVGVEAYRGGTLPAQNLGTQGQAAQFGLAGLVASQNLRATQEAQAAYTQSMRDLSEDRRLDLMRLAAQRPELMASYLGDLRTANMQQLSVLREFQQQKAEADSAQRALDFKYAELRADAATAADKLRLDKWYKSQKVAIDQYRASIYAQNAATSAFNAQTSRQRANQAGAGPGGFGGPTFAATVSNAIAKLPTNLKEIKAAESWVWSRIRKEIPAKDRRKARTYLRRQLKALRLAQAPSSSSGGGYGGGSLGTGAPE